MKEVVTGQDIGKSKYEEVFEKELDVLGVEYGIKKKESNIKKTRRDTDKNEREK